MKPRLEQFQQEAAEIAETNRNQKLLMTEFRLYSPLPPLSPVQMLFVQIP
jgi:hypothetical protein